MAPRHICDAEGFWVAFVVGAEVFLRGGEWLGRLGENNAIFDHYGRVRGFLDDAGRLVMVQVETVRSNVPVQDSSCEMERGTEKVR